MMVRQFEQSGRDLDEMTRNKIAASEVPISEELCTVTVASASFWQTSQILSLMIDY